MKYMIVLLTLLITSSAYAEEGIERGEALFTSRCDACHQAPKAKSLTLNQWRAVLKTMKVRMKQAGMNPLTSEEAADLDQFLEANAR
ncbi:MAG: hypothetical protein Q9M20_02010 [Mariprofundaceae bacterium]|nr:hypothetical protein [Mariprofundaceae bacterium]